MVGGVPLVLDADPLRCLSSRARARPCSRCISSAKIQSRFGPSARSCEVVEDRDERTLGMGLRGGHLLLANARSRRWPVRRRDRVPTLDGGEHPGAAPDVAPRMYGLPHAPDPSDRYSPFMCTPSNASGAEPITTMSAVVQRQLSTTRGRAMPPPTRAPCPSPAHGGRTSSSPHQPSRPFGPSVMSAFRALEDLSRLPSGSRKETNRP